MYIPSYLPCFKCFTGPDVWRDECGHVQAECDCGKIRTGVAGMANMPSNDYEEDELKRLSIEWNDAHVREFYDKPLR